MHSTTDEIPRQTTYWILKQLSISMTGLHSQRFSNGMESDNRTNMSHFFIYHSARFMALVQFRNLKHHRL